jgi:hypothetical protein
VEFRAVGNLALRASPQAFTSPAFSLKDDRLAAFYSTEKSEEPLF